MDLERDSMEASLMSFPRQQEEEAQAGRAAARPACAWPHSPATVRQAVRSEKKSISDELFDEAMILFNQIIEVLTLPQFTRSRKRPGGFYFLERFGRPCLFVHSTHTRSPGMALPRESTARYSSIHIPLR